VRWLHRIHIGKREQAVDDEAAAVDEDQPMRLDRGEVDNLSKVVAPPKWLEDLGRSSWLLVGFFAVVAGLIWLLGATYAIVGPVVAGTVVAAVASPLVGLMQRRHVPRVAAAAIVLLGLVALAVVIGVLVLAGIKDQSSAISSAANEAATAAQGWLKSVGVDQSGSEAAKSSVTQATPSIVKTLTHGIVSGIKGITSLAFALSFFALSLFFLLKDGPSLRASVDRHLGVPQRVAQTITGGVIRSLRGYFKGVTFVAAFNGVVVGLGALILGVPLAGTIAVVTFVTAYIPYIGAFAAGAFAVIIALGTQGTTTAVLMLVIVILANGLLQNIFQPFAMGSALNLHPLVVLVVTIGAGCIFGTLGLILAAPLLSAAVHIVHDLSQARSDAELAEPATLSPSP